MQKLEAQKKKRAELARKREEKKNGKKTKQKVKK